MSAVRGGPRVSVIVPVYNLRRYLPVALESVLAQKLSPGDIEVIVVDDGSTDGSGELARSYGARVRCIRQENRGLPATRNAGLRAAKAPFVTFLDADDRLLPDKLATELQAFAEHPEAAVVHSGWYCIDDAGRRLPELGWSREEGDVFPRLVLGNLIPLHAAMVRREVIEDAGGFDERLTALEDWDLWLRISRRGARWHAIPRLLAEYRIRAGAMHADASRMLTNRLRVLDRLFAEPTLPAAVLDLRARAYQNAYLAAACDYYREGDRGAGARAFHAAVAARPAILGEPRSWRLVARWLLPVGHRRQAVVVARWEEIAGTLRLMLADLFEVARPGGEIHARRWQARIACWGTIARLARKRAVSRLVVAAGGWRA